MLFGFSEATGPLAAQDYGFNRDDPAPKMPCTVSRPGEIASFNFLNPLI
jgi:hypothetical protein